MCSPGYLDPRAVLDADARLRERFPNLLSIERPHYAPSATAATAEQRERSLDTLFGDFYEAMTGEPIGEAEREAFIEVHRAFESQRRETGP